MTGRAPKITGRAPKITKSRKVLSFLWSLSNIFLYRRDEKPKNLILSLVLVEYFSLPQRSEQRSTHFKHEHSWVRWTRLCVRFLEFCDETPFYKPETCTASRRELYSCFSGNSFRSGNVASSLTGTTVEEKRHVLSASPAITLDEMCQMSAWIPKLSNWPCSRINCPELSRIR